MDKPTAAMLLVFTAHVTGIAVLLWLALSGDRFDWRGWWPHDDDGGGGGGEPGAPEPDGPGGIGVPLADAEPAAVRLRTEHERLPGSRRRVRRAPRHAPEPARTREPR